jgi:cell division transport system permease protein
VGVVLRVPFGPGRPSGSGLLNAVRNTFRLLFAGAVRAWLRNLGGTAPALGSMTVLLLLTGLVGLSAFAMRQLAAQEAGSAAVLHVYLRDDASVDAVSALKARLAGDRRVASLGFTSKAQALQQAQQRPGLPDLAGAADENPFPASLDVRLRSVSDVGALARTVSGDAAVDPILPTSYQPGAYQRIQGALTVLAVVGVAFLALLGFVAVTVTANSIRATILARGDELSVMQLVGAPRWMVRGPFLVEGALTGGCAGFLAGLVTLVVSLVVVAAGASTFAQIAPGISVRACLIAGAGTFVAGLLLGSVASMVSVHRQLEPATG